MIKAVKKIEEPQLENMVELMYQICIMRYKLKMLWFSINKAEVKTRKDIDTDDNLDEESKTTELSQG